MPSLERRYSARTLAVKSSVEGMTGLHVSEVSIVVQGIVSAGKEEETAPEKEE